MHYQWKGQAPNVTNSVGEVGKAAFGFNTYCGTPMSSRRSTCLACHAGNGKTPTSTMNETQLGNIDCLMCHQDKYQRKFASPFESLAFTDNQGTSRTWKFPVEDAMGNVQFMPDEAKMGITATQAAQTVHKPTRVSCLRCHANAAGSDGAKRGDLSSVSANPPLANDFHMSPQGANLACQACHQSQNHHMLGRGLDLLENDRPERLLCNNCHGAKPHNNAQIDNHTERVACQTCHIPTYGKDMPTEVMRDWSTPAWNPAGFSGQGSFKPSETKAGNLTPSYLWFDGTSQVYTIGQKAMTKNAAGEYDWSVPNGNIHSAGAQIFPMKEHRSGSARLTSTGVFIPHSAFTFFATGDIIKAVEEGKTWSGMSGAWTWEIIHGYQTINHGVAPRASALQCADCHGSTTRLDLKGKLGYALKGATTTVCRQCHGAESMPSFTKVHSIHVSEERYDCSMCHTFSRPSRGLRTR